MLEIVDMHCDTLSFLETETKEGGGEAGADTLLHSSGQLDLMRMKDSGYLLQNFAVFVDAGEYPRLWSRAMQLVGRFRREMQRHSDMVRQVFSWKDLEENRRKGIMSALLTIEEGGICEGKVERLWELHRMGARMMTLTWNYPNELGAPASPVDGGGCDSPRGLTQIGGDFVREMERLGMIPDVSHLSDQGFWDLEQITHKPFVASHSNSRSVCSHPRNLTDEMIHKIGERGGVIGLNFYERFLREKEEDIMESLVSHARRITELGGMEVLGLGSDFDGIPVNESLPGAQNMGKLWDALHDGGFTQRELDGIFSGNVLRVYREVLK